MTAGGREHWLFGTSSPVDIVAEAQRAEHLGFHGFMVGDSQNLKADCYVALTMAAASTTHLRLGTAVTNPWTRHPAVTASAIASLHLASGGRAVLGIGRGDSALHDLGFAPASIGLLRDYVDVVGRYLAGDAVPASALARWNDGSLPPIDSAESGPAESRLSWLPSHLGPVPIDIAATGPKVLALGATHASRVTLAVGTDPARVRWAVDQIREARSRAGLDPAGVSIGSFVTIVVHDDIERARSLGSMYLATTMRFSAMHGNTVGPASDDDQRRIEAVSALYKVGKHAAAAGILAEAPDLVDRFGMFGPAALCVDRLDELIELGLDRFVFGAVSGGSTGATVDPDVRATADRAVVRLADDVLPHLS